jgi:hypothetical protein
MWRERVAAIEDGIAFIWRVLSVAMLGLTLIGIVAATTWLFMQ